MNTNPADGATNPLDIVILGLSITSSWGNGHATTYRALVRGLVERGHHVLFLERDMPWYAANRDLPEPPFGRTSLYHDLADLKRSYAEAVRAADLVIVGSYVPQGVEVGQWVIATTRGLAAFYDIDTPVTLAKLRRGDYEYLSPRLVEAYDLYLSFTGGAILEQLEHLYGSPAARPLYCAVDPAIYHPEQQPLRWDLGYMGTYSADRQPKVEEMLLAPAAERPLGHFAVAGPNFPDVERWPGNVTYIPHLPPDRHRRFYNEQRFTLNVTRADMVAAGYAPSVRLFEAGACGTPVISDNWEGLEQFFTPGHEILVASSQRQVSQFLWELAEAERQAIGDRARRAVLARHTAVHRAQALEAYVAELGVWSAARIAS